MAFEVKSWNTPDSWPPSFGRKICKSSGWLLAAGCISGALFFMKSLVPVLLGRGTFNSQLVRFKWTETFKMFRRFYEILRFFTFRGPKVFRHCGSLRHIVEHSDSLPHGSHFSIFLLWPQRWQRMIDISQTPPMAGH